MVRTVKLYKTGEFTCIDITENGITTYLSTDKGRDLVVIDGGVKILPDPEEAILNNFKILIDELDDNFGATTGKQLRDEILARNFFKKGGGGVSGETPIELASFVVKGTNFGKYEDGQTVPQHETLNERFTDAFRKAIAPIFNLPLATLSANILPATNREVGESLSLSFSSVYTQNDAGNVTGTVYKKDNVNLVANTSNITLSTTAIVFQSSVNYSAGTAPKLNNLGESIANPIVAGVVNSNTLSYIGYRAVFYGATATKNTTSANVRANLIKRLENTGNTFNLESGSTHNIFQLWLPMSKNLVSVIDLDALNANITASYIEEILSVNDANGNPIAGKLYTMQQDVPYSTNHRHQITIS